MNDNLDKLFGRHGIEIVYRVSCAVFCSFFLLFLSTLAWPATHHMFLGIFLLILIFFTWLFLWGIKSSGWINGYRVAARIGSFIYLILQLMAFVDMAFTIHELLIVKMEETNVVFFSISNM